MAAGPLHKPKDDTDDVVSLDAFRKRPVKPPADDTSSRTMPAPPPPPPTPPDRSELKFKIKKHNERMKLIASAFSGVGVGVLGVGFVQPFIRDAAQFAAEYRPIWYFAGLVLHACGHIQLHFNLRKED